jgi:hypothetical protein
MPSLRQSPWSAWLSIPRPRRPGFSSFRSCRPRSLLAQGKLASDRERHAADVAKAKAELGARQDALRQREIGLADREARARISEDFVAGSVRGSPDTEKISKVNLPSADARTAT